MSDKKTEEKEIVKEENKEEVNKAASHIGNTPKRPRPSSED